MVSTTYSYGQTILPFGKHRGKRLSEVPTSYLRWALASCDALDHWTRAAMKEELGRRGQKYVQADEVLHALEERITSAVVDDDDIDHGTAVLVSEHLMVAFQEVRARYEIVSATEMMLRPQGPPRRWGEEHDD
jgi:hypothetical protein